MRVLPVVRKTSAAALIALILAGCGKAMTEEEIKASCEKDAGSRGADAVDKCVKDTKSAQDYWYVRMTCKITQTC